VWAIKDEERANFARMTDNPVLAMPHIDPFRTLRRPEPDRDGYLRVGIIGARNNVNRANVTAFLNQATPIFRDAFAPLKIVIGGTLCETLVGLDNPFVDLRGPVGNVEDFYSSVDCVAVPMRTSSGLKIKTGEALSLGCPVLSLAHAFEGYEPADKLHALADFPALAHALVDLSFAPHPALEALAAASLRAHAATAVGIDTAWARTAELVRSHEKTVVVAVDTQSLVPGTVLNLSLLSMIEFLQRFANVSVLAVRGSGTAVADNPAALDRFRRVLLSADLLNATEHNALLEFGAEVVDVRTYLDERQPRLVIADALHDALFAGDYPKTTIVSRMELIAHSEGRADFTIPESGFRAAFVATPALSLELCARIAKTDIQPVLEPCFCQSNAIDAMRAPDYSGVKSVALLGDSANPDVTLAVAMARSWKIRPLIVQGIGKAGADLASSCFDASSFVASIASKRIPPPSFAMDFSAGDIGLPLCRELLERLHVPLVSARGVALHGSLALSARPLVAATPADLWEAFRWFALGSEKTFVRKCAPSWRDYESGRGWSWMKRHYDQLSAVDSTETTSVGSHAHG
jgi:hypothetical protein